MKRALVGTVLTAVAVRLAMLGGAGESLQNWTRELTDGGLLRATLSLELGPEESETPALIDETLPAGVSGLRTMRVEVEARGAKAPPVPVAQTACVEIKNDTSFWVSGAAVSAEELTQNFAVSGPQILIIHTHSSEAYTQVAGDTYAESDPYRTEDMSHSVVRVGDELALRLESYGLTVLHDRNIYDYPSYTGSYTRTEAAVEAYIAQYPGIAMVIDLHRDAIGSGDDIYRTQACVDGEECAQVMMLIGTGENGLYHPQWRENLKLAVYLQSAVDAACPGLMRPIALKQERYNQQLTTGSMILEVGSSGNTLEEALIAIRHYGDAVGPALKKLAEG